MSGSLAVLFARNGDDIHIVPAAQKAMHGEGVSCWCNPRLEFVAPNGGRLYLHRRGNDQAYPHGAQALAAATRKLGLIR